MVYLSLASISSAELIPEHQVDEVFFSYSDVSYENIMHAASKVIAAGASFVLLGLRRTSAEIKKASHIHLGNPDRGGEEVPLQEWWCRGSRRANLKAVIVRHPMPYGDLEAQTVQHFKSIEDFKKHKITIEEEEEYADHIEQGTDVLSGVDYQKILELAESMADVIIWDGGNNDFSFYVSDYTITVTDPLQGGRRSQISPKRSKRKNC